VTVGFMPGVIVKNVPPGVNDPGIIPCGVVTHIAVSLADSLPPSGDSGKDWHFYVTFDGTIEQYRSIYFEADAQFAGNSFVLDGVRRGFVSIESQGLGDGTWTDAQLASIANIILWVHSQESFPLAKCPAWNAPGVGYHRLFDEWNENHHSCPGDARVRQFDTILLPMLKEADVTPTEIDAIADAVLTNLGKGRVADPRPDHAGETRKLETVLEAIWSREETLMNQHEQIMIVLSELMRRTPAP